MKKYKDFMSANNVADLREKVMNIMYDENHTITSLAKAIGLQNHTLSKFIKEEGNVHILTVMKIDEYVNNFLRKI